MASNVYSDFLKTTIDLDEVSEVIFRQTGRRYSLAPLEVKCTYPVFRGDSADSPPVFVKIGTHDEWQRTANLLREIGVCGLFAKFMTKTPPDYRGHAVFVMEWKESVLVRPEDMTETQVRNFVASCVMLSNTLQRVTDFTPVDGSSVAPEALYATLQQYADRHPIAGRLLKGLLKIPVAERTFSGHRLSVLHGDFHAKNFGFAQDDLVSVYDFDQLTQGLACGDLTNALVERFSCMGLSSAARGRLRRVACLAVEVSPWPQAEFAIMCNVLRLRFAARRINKHPNSAWVAFDVLRRDGKIREFLQCLGEG